MVEGSQSKPDELPDNPESPAITLDVVSSDSAWMQLAEKDPVRVLSLATDKVDLDKQRESNRHREEKGRQNIVFASLAAIVVIFLASFAYAGMTEKEGLSEKVIDTMLGILGGGGAVAAVTAAKRN